MKRLLRTSAVKPEIGLYRANVIKAKAPAFWQSLMECVEADCAYLNEIFHDDLRRQCIFKSDDEACSLQGHTHTRNILRLRLNVEGLEIHQEYFTGVDRTPERSSLTFDIDTNERLFLTGIDGRISSPELASELLIKSVTWE